MKVFLFALMISIQSHAASLRCQHETFCVHERMPLWSQSDGGWGGMNFNGAAIPLIPYVNQKEGTNISTSGSDPGWCTPTAMGMLINSYAKELQSANYSITKETWIAQPDPSVLIHTLMKKMETNIIQGGTYDSKVGVVLKTVANSNGATYKEGDLITVSEYISSYNNPLIQLTIEHETQGWGHSVAVNGTDRQYYVIYDPWGAVYDVTYDRSAKRLAYISPKRGDGNSVYGSITQWGGARLRKSYVAYNYASANANQIVPASITQQPQSLTRSEGSSINLTVGVAGTPNFSFQWYFNGSPINGATNSFLTMNNIQRSQAGNYSVVVTNFLGSVTSVNSVISVFTFQDVQAALREVLGQNANDDLVSFYLSSGFDIAGIKQDAQTKKNTTAKYYTTIFGRQPDNKEVNSYLRMPASQIPDAVKSDYQRVIAAATLINLFAGEENP